MGAKVLSLGKSHKQQEQKNQEQDKLQLTSYIVGGEMLVPT